MAFRRPPSGTSNSTYSYSNTAAPTLPPASASPVTPDDINPAPIPSPTMRKRQRTLDMHSGTTAPADPQAHHGQPGAPSVTEDAFINDQDAVDSGPDEDDEEEKPKSDKKAGRRKIKIEFIQDKSRRHITFSKRKAGIMKKAYELSTLTGTQVLLLVVSETGLVYTFTTAKLQPLVTQPEGKNLIQACLNAPHGTLPSSLPVGAPIGRSSGPLSMGGPTSGPNNLPGGLSISGSPSGGIKEDEGEADDDEISHGARVSNAGEKRRRRTSSTAAAASASGPNTRSSGPGVPTSPHSPNTSIPPPLSIPPPSQHPQQGSQQQHQQSPSQQPPQGAPPQIALGSPTSPQQQHSQTPASPAQYSPGSYGGHGGHHQHPQHQHDAGMYSGHMIPPSGPYSYAGPGGPGGQAPGQPLGGLAAAAAQQHGHWAPGPQPQVSPGGHYGRR